MKQKLLSERQTEIVRVLYKKGGYLTIHSLAKETGYADATIKKEINYLIDSGAVVNIKSNDQTVVDTKKPSRIKNSSVMRYNLNYPAIYGKTSK